MKSQHLSKTPRDDLVRLARKRAGMRMGWFIHLFVFVSVNLLLAVVSAAGGRYWAFFPLLGWGLGLAIHGTVVFLRIGGLGLYEALIAKERARLVRSDPHWYPASASNHQDHSRKQA